MIDNIMIQTIPTYSIQDFGDDNLLDILKQAIPKDHHSIVLEKIERKEVAPPPFIPSLVFAAPCFWRGGRCFHGGSRL